MKAGLYGKLYIVTVTGETPSIGNEINLAKDVEIDLSNEKIKCPDRSNNGFNRTISGMKDLTISTTINFDPSNTESQAILDAYDNGTSLGLAVLYQDKTIAAAEGNYGLIGTFALSLKWKQPLNEAQTIDVEASLDQYLGKFSS